MIGHGPNWLEGRTVYEQEGAPIAAHLRAMGERYDEGKLLLGGAFESGHEGIAVLNVGDEADARALMDSDPAVKAGIFSYELRVLTAYFDDFDGTRTAERV